MFRTSIIALLATLSGCTTINTVQQNHQVQVVRTAPVIPEPQPVVEVITACAPNDPDPECYD